MLAKSAVKYIQSLGQKKFREKEGVFVAEGPKIIGELLSIPRLRPVRIYALKQWYSENPALEISLAHAERVVISESELEHISGLITPNKVLAVFEIPFFEPAGFENRISLALDGIQDPGNLGTIVRIADWFGVGQIVCSPDCADPFNPKTVQSTMGSIGRVNLLTRDLNLFIDAQPGLPLYAATLGGSSLYELEPLSSALVVIGNESRGITPELLSRIKTRITIPRLGSAESLNAAVATGIILSHLVKG